MHARGTTLNVAPGIDSGPDQRYFPHMHSALIAVSDIPLRPGTTRNDIRVVKSGFKDFYSLTSRVRDTLRSFLGLSFIACKFESPRN